MATTRKKPPLQWEELPLRARKAAQTRYALFSAFRAAVRKTRFAEITVGEICRRVGVTEPTFYKYFPEKTDVLVYGIMLWGIETGWKLAQLPQSTDPIEKLEWLFDESARMFAIEPRFSAELLSRQALRIGPPKFLEISIAERICAFPDHAGIEKHPGQGIVALITPLVRQAKRAGRLPGAVSIDEVVQALVSVFFGVPTFTMWEDPHLVKKRYRQQLEIIWRGLGAR